MRWLIILGSALAVAACAGPPIGTEGKRSRHVACAEPLEAIARGTGPPLVMIGGGLVGNENWRQHAERLSADRQIIQLQNMTVAYGLENRALPGDYSIAMESCALGKALDRMGLTSPVDLAGHSLGALIALDFALHNPHRVRTLTLSEPPAAWLLDPADRSDPRVREWARVITGLRKPEISDADMYRFLCAVGACPAPSLEAARQQPGWAERNRYRRSLRGVYAVVEHRDDPRLIARFPRPLLYVAGIGTAPVHELINRKFERLRPDARVLRLPGAHSAAQVSKDVFLTELEAFLEQPERRPASGR